MAISLGSKGVKFPGMIGTFCRVFRVRNMDEIFFDDRSTQRWSMVAADPTSWSEISSKADTRNYGFSWCARCPAGGNGRDRAVNAPINAITNSQVILAH